MRLTSSLVLILAAASLAAPAFAQDEGGSVDLAAFKTKRIEKMMRLDTDRDGKISQAEFDARKQGGGEGKGGKLFALADRNHDGYLTPDEIGAIVDRRFAKLDANHDGKLDASERQAAHHGRGQQPTGF